MARRYSMVKIDAYLATSRMHQNNKTLGQLRTTFREVFAVLRRHYDYVPSNWIFGYGHYLLTGQNAVFAAPRPNPANVGLCLLLGSYYNKRHLLRYWKDMWTMAAQARM
jgi:hypothetical protein